MNEEATAGAAVEETSAKAAPAAFPSKSKKAAAKPAKKKAAPAKAAKPAAKKAVKKAAAPKAAKRPVAKKKAVYMPKEAKKAGRVRGVAAEAPKRGRPRVNPPKIEYKTDYKAGDRVKVARRSGETVKGKVTSVDMTATGAFINVNIGDARKPVMIAARPAAVKSY